MEYELQDLFDLPRLQALLAGIHDAFSLPITITDNDGNILTSSGWQDVCARFHRSHPATNSICRDHDCQLQSLIRDGGEAVSQRCPLGLMDCAAGIVIDGQLVGSAFTGQVFLEAPDLDYFRAQAERFGFDVESYLGAIADVPVLTPEQLGTKVTFLSRFAQVLADAGLSRVKERAATDALRREREQLEAQVAQRTSELQAAALLQRNAQEDLQRQAYQLEQEIAERQQAQEALSRSEHFLNMIIETEPECVKMLDRDGRVIMMNRAGIAMLEADSFEEVKEANLQLAILPEYRQAFEAAASQVFQGKQATVEFQMTGLRGRRIWLESHAAPFRDESGQVVALLAITRDVTQRKQDEESIRMLSQAVNQSPVSIVLTDTQGNITFVNPKFTQLTGYSREEALGKTPRILKSETTPPAVHKNLWETIASGKVWDGVLQNRKKNGELFWEHAAIAPIVNEKGEITSYIAVKEDITERKALEAQLFQAQKMEAIGHLAGGIAHDFNNILTAIIGFANLLEMRMAEDDPRRLNLKHITASAERAADLTRSLLAFSRKQILNPEPVDLNEIVVKMKNFLQRIIGEDIELKTVLHGEALKVNVDRGQIEQVLMNLASNARDAMPDGGGLTIETAPVAIDERFIARHGYGKQGRYALVSITDTGTGMDEKTAKRIFEPFFTTKEVGKGTGLGMSIVYGIVKQHSGYINLSSSPRAGTTFTIYLPLLSGAISERPEVAEEAPVGGTETILVADDDASLRELTRQVLEEFGYQVITACDGYEAIARYRDNRDAISLVVMDIIMPRMNGRDAYKIIKELRPDCKALFVSGYAADIIERRGVLDGGLELLFKPLRPNLLLKKVREILDRPDRK